MSVPLTLSQKFTTYSPFVIQLGKKVTETILLYCEDNQYAFTYRQKTLGSLAEKIETGRFKRWSELDDFFACSIIIPTLANEDQVIAYCKQQFCIKGMIKRGQTRKPPDVFRFDSTRLTCRLRLPDGLDSVGMSIYDVNFEIQIRSAFEHAWSVTTHALTYKTDVIDWKRLRLAAQIKASVEQLDMLILSFDQAAPFISENPWPEVRDKKKIAEILQGYFDNGLIPTELVPKDLSRFCDNIYSLLKANNKVERISEFISFISSQLNILTSETIPRSISLFQLMLGILVDAGFILELSEQLTYHVTPELVNLFPKSAHIHSTFDYEH